VLTTYIKKISITFWFCVLCFFVLNCSTFLIQVYDFGGGTLDVSLLFVSQGSVQVFAIESIERFDLYSQVFASDGDEMLGGSDLDVSKS
jgi:hypothetical protein